MNAAGRLNPRRIEDRVRPQQFDPHGNLFLGVRCGVGFAGCRRAARGSEHTRISLP
jgi:hypothetical protein